MKEVKMTFIIDELFDDIEGEMFVNGYVMPDDSQPSKHTAIDILAEGNKELAWRRMKLAAAEVGEILYAYTKVPAYTLVVDDTLGEPKSFEYTLNVKDEFSQTTITLLIEYIHLFIVSRVLSYWMNKVNPNAAENYYIENESAKDNISKAMGKLGKGKRITPAPF